jgi:branched-chain amino acid transport system permease protein
VFALASWREALYLAAPRLVPLLGIPLLALALDAYGRKVLVSTLVFALLALSWDLLAITGIVSLGQALFFGLGAYVAGALDHAFGWPPVVTIPVATVGGAALSTALLLPVLRLRRIYFSMVTLVLPLILVRVVEATKVLGGTEGLHGLTPFSSSAMELAVVMVAFWAAFFGFRRLAGSDYGLVLQGIRDNDRAVMSAGIDVNAHRAQALFVASAVGAFAGAFMTHAYMFVGMPAFALDYSILPIAAAVVGGVGSFAGSALGAFILVPLSEALRGLGGLRIVLYALLLVVFTVALPEGVFHYLKRKYEQFERWAEVEA